MNNFDYDEEFVKNLLNSDNDSETAIARKSLDKHIDILKNTSFKVIEYLEFFLRSLKLNNDEILRKHLFYMVGFNIILNSGVDFDEVLFNECLKEYLQQYNNIEKKNKKE